MRLPEASRNKAFTLIELLIVITILMATLAGSISLYGRLQVSAQLNEQTAKVIGALRTAHLRALKGIGNSSWGVYMDIQESADDRVIVYQGSSYASRTADSDLIEIIPASIGLSFQLSTTTPEIVFSRPSGNPSATGTLLLTLLPGDTRTISVNRLGIVNEE